MNATLSIYLQTIQYSTIQYDTEHGLKNPPSSFGVEHRDREVGDGGALDWVSGAGSNIAVDELRHPDSWFAGL